MCFDALQVSEGRMNVVRGKMCRPLLCAAIREVAEYFNQRDFLLSDWNE